MSYPTVNAMVADVVSAGDAPRGYALLYWANNTGIAASAWVGGMLAGRSWLGLFTVDAVSTLAFAALVAARVPESRPTAQTEAGRGGWKSVLRDGPFVSFLLTHFAFMLVFWQFQFALPLAIVRAGLEPRTYGNAIAANCLFILVLQPLVARKLGGRDPGSLLAIASLSIGLGYGAYALCTTAWQFYAATLVWTVGDLVGLPLISAVVASMSPVDLRGRYQGAQMLAHSAAMVMAPLIAGALIEALGMNTLWTGCLALGTITAIAHFLLGAARKRRSPARHLPV